MAHSSTWTTRLQGSWINLSDLGEYVLSSDTVIPTFLSGLACKFVGGSDPGGGLAEAAGGVQGVFGCAGEGAGG